MEATADDATLSCEVLYPAISSQFTQCTQNNIPCLSRNWHQPLTPAGAFIFTNELFNYYVWKSRQLKSLWFDVGCDRGEKRRHSKSDLTMLDIFEILILLVFTADHRRQLAREHCSSSWTCWGNQIALLLDLSLRAETKTNRRKQALVGSMICKPFCLV